VVVRGLVSPSVRGHALYNVNRRLLMLQHRSGALRYSPNFCD